jgi:hypothetical protein
MHYMHFIMTTERPIIVAKIVIWYEFAVREALPWTFVPKDCILRLTSRFPKRL